MKQLNFSFFLIVCAGALTPPALYSIDNNWNPSEREEVARHYINSNEFKEEWIPYERAQKRYRKTVEKENMQDALYNLIQSRYKKPAEDWFRGWFGETLTPKQMKKERLAKFYQDLGIAPQHSDNQLYNTIQIGQLRENLGLLSHIRKQLPQDVNDTSVPAKKVHIDPARGVWVKGNPFLFEAGIEEPIIPPRKEFTQIKADQEMLKQAAFRESDAREGLSKAVESYQTITSNPDIDKLLHTQQNQENAISRLSKALAATQPTDPQKEQDIRTMTQLKEKLEKSVSNIKDDLAYRRAKSDFEQTKLHRRIRTLAGEYAMARQNQYDYRRKIQRIAEQFLDYNPLYFPAATTPSVPANNTTPSS